MCTNFLIWVCLREGGKDIGRTKNARISLFLAWHNTPTNTQCCCVRDQKRRAHSTYVRMCAWRRSVRLSFYVWFIFLMRRDIADSVWMTMHERYARDLKRLYTFAWVDSFFFVSIITIFFTLMMLETAWAGRGIRTPCLAAAWWIDGHRTSLRKECRRAYVLPSLFLSGASVVSESFVLSTIWLQTPLSRSIMGE